eukprot:scaffold69276_cov27-Cyclotella_meneghiniana.AAC.1
MSQSRNVPSRLDNWIDRDGRSWYTSTKCRNDSHERGVLGWDEDGIRVRHRRGRVLYLTIHEVRHVNNETKEKETDGTCCLT